MKVGILAYEDCFASEIFGFADLLTVANRSRARRASMLGSSTCRSSRHDVA